MEPFLNGVALAIDQARNSYVVAIRVQAGSGWGGRGAGTTRSQQPSQLLAHACMRAKLLQSCLTLCNLRDCSPQGSSVCGILWAKYWSWLPCPPPGDLPDPGIKPTSLMSPALAGRFFTTEPSGKPLLAHSRC